LSHRKKGQEPLEHHTLKIIEIARTLKVSTYKFLESRGNLEIRKVFHVKRTGKSGRNCKTTPRLDRKIVKMSLSNRRSSYRKISSALELQDSTYIQER